MDIRTNGGHRRRRPLVTAFALACAMLGAARADAATYNVGPGQAYASIGAVPWESIAAGDVVQIHWRSTPYKEKWVICRRGTSAAPIVVRGVLGPNGERPVIDGRGATTRTQLSFWAGPRGVIVIGGASVPSDTTPAWITIENLDVLGAHPSDQFTDDAGATKSYTSAASAIYVEKGEHITIRNTIMRDSANGFFVASSDELASANIVVENNYIYGNGIEGSVFQHNSYTAAKGILFQGNRYGPLRSGASGNNLKDRSSGLVIRYNWIEGGNRQLDLVEAEDSSQIRNAPDYGQTYVYGNVLIEPNGEGNRQIVHYGGDHPGMEQDFKKGTLYFYNNTIVSQRSDRTSLLRLSTNDERADVRNNIVYTTAAGSSLEMLADGTGRLTLRRNWMKSGWVRSFAGLSGTVDDDGSTIGGSGPGFANESGQDYTLTSGSNARDAGVALVAAVLPSHDVNNHYVRHQAVGVRPRSDTLDLGAFEYGSGGGPPPPPAPPQPASNLRITS